MFAEEPSVSISINISQDVTATTTDQAIMDDENIPPEFFEEPQSMTIEEGGMARFVCDVDGEPVPTGNLVILLCYEVKVTTVFVQARSTLDLVQTIYYMKKFI